MVNYTDNRRIIYFDICYSLILLGLQQLNLKNFLQMIRINC